MNLEDSHPKPDGVTFLTCLKGSWLDRILLLSLFLGTFFLWSAVQAHLSAGEPTAFVYHQKQLLASYPLPTDYTIIHVSAEGELGISEIEISKSGIRFLSSPCHTKYCTLSGEKSQAGSVIACVPNHILVVIRGSSAQENKQTFDAITE